MNSDSKNKNKQLYNHLRTLTCTELWGKEVPKFNKSKAKERSERVALVRAVGVVVSESGTHELREEVRQWLLELLKDPDEKIRRYAMAALPKLGASETEEKVLLSLLKKPTNEREKKFVAQALDKIGGAETLETIKRTPGLLPQTELKVAASVARDENPSAIRLDKTLAHFDGLQIHLRGRTGLEQIVRDEAVALMAANSKFRIGEVRPGLVVLTPLAAFSLGDLYQLRCFGTLGLVLGTAGRSSDGEAVASLAAVITSPLAHELLKTFTEGSLRYRLDFIGKGHQRSTVRELANRAYALCPEILNDARSAPWTIAIHPVGHGYSVELSPKMSDPRFAYRQDDVPAASHPPLAACMARLAGVVENEVVWDPFCGSGLELIERSRLGGVQRIYGTDRSDEAIAIAGQNLAAAGLSAIPTHLTACDFRDFASIEGVKPRSVSLVITNPPLGKRIPIPNLRGLILDLFEAAATALKSGGRLVLVNPFWLEAPHPLMKLESRTLVDIGGFNCRLEKYLKL